MSMRIAVIGAGVVGVTTAYELAVDGHEVTVYERHGGIATEGSFANAGLLSPAYLGAWGAPGMARGLSGRQARLQPTGLAWAGHAAWLWRWWRAGRPPRQRTLLDTLHQLARRSQDRLQELTHVLQLDFERQHGQLVLLRSAREQRRLQSGLAWLESTGQTGHDLLTPEQARELEPALSPDTPLHAAIHLSGGESVNCRQFAQLLKGHAQDKGVTFLMHQDVLNLTSGDAPVVRARARGDDVASRLMIDTEAALEETRGAGRDASLSEKSFDAVVVCAAMASPALLAPLGLKLPLAAVQGQTITAPLHASEPLLDTVPHLSILDERHQVVLSRMGHRMRVAGGCSLGAADVKLRQGAALLYRVLNDWFPGAAQTSRATVWQGVRAALPDGLPVVGPSGAPGIWLNLGHGANGFALSCGSARLLADQIARRDTTGLAEGMGVERLR